MTHNACNNGKRSPISQVSNNLSHGIKSMDHTEWMGTSDTWNQPSTTVYYLYEHGMSNSLHVMFLD